MKRNSLVAMFERQPYLAQLLHECVGCNAVGLKPGVIHTQLGDYGIRQSLSRKYGELLLDQHGLCPVCSEASLEDADVAKGY